MKEFNIKLAYKKHHLIFVKKLVANQKIQREQRKTFEHLLFKSYCLRVVRQNQLEALRRAISKKVTRLLRFHLAKQPNIMVTAKPREIRMGKGKGAFSHWVSVYPLGSRVVTLHWCHYGYLIKKLAAISGSLKKSNLFLRGL